MWQRCRLRRTLQTFAARRVTKGALIEPARLFEGRASNSTRGYSVHVAKGGPYNTSFNCARFKYRLTMLAMHPRAGERLAPGSLCLTMTARLRVRPPQELGVLQPGTIEEIVRAVVALYDVEAGRCRADVCTLLHHLLERGLVEVREPA